LNLDNAGLKPALLFSGLAMPQSTDAPDTRTRRIAMLLRSALIAAGLTLAFATPAHADRLLIDRAQASESANLPARGQSMAQVEAKFGAPTQKLAPRGGQSEAWPVIHRWEYPEFTVYFERSRVIDSVLNRASPQETGPAPVQQP
jgi:hypothetical protein